MRVAVRRSLHGVDGPVAAAVSGGADSLALAAGLAFVRPGSAALVVDHGLQACSAEVAARAAAQCRELGLTATVLTPSGLTADGGGRAVQRGGPEARARDARYAALERAAGEAGLAAVLLGHTLDDQAETVLLGLARGSGARALAGMAPVRGLHRRPLLGLSRAVARAACAEAGLRPWQDPHNEDAAYTRVRVRTAVLPVLEQALGPGVAAALARTAAQLREDVDALDALTPDTDDVPTLTALPAALRARAIKRWAERACGGAVTAAHVAALRALVEDWRGQGPVSLPGGVQARREGPRLASAP